MMPVPQQLLPCNAGNYDVISYTCTLQVKMSALTRVCSTFTSFTFSPLIMWITMGVIGIFYTEIKKVLLCQSEMKLSLQISLALKSNWLTGVFGQWYLFCREGDWSLAGLDWRSSVLSGNTRRCLWLWPKWGSSNRGRLRSPVFRDALQDEGSNFFLVEMCMSTCEMSGTV